MFPVNGSLRMAPLFPRSGPGESGSPTSQVLLRCYDFPSRLSGRLFASLPGSTLPSSVRVSQLALALPRTAPQRRRQHPRCTRDADYEDQKTGSAAGMDQSLRMAQTMRATAWLPYDDPAVGSSEVLICG
jgi:hypothetical protein